ncbi:hypothetical protein HT031_001493 [Scenedesmus sp. PABB004]|nr:hypothetical protein HT031_001493 [Scenedesmus sp. PABB004]
MGLLSLTVRSPSGSAACMVDEGASVAQLAQLLWERHADTLGLPRPEQQRLIFRHALLPADAALKQAGVASGDQLVVLAARPPTQPRAPQTTPAANAVAIRGAITDEARRRGLEHTLSEERPRPAARRGVALPAELMDGDLLQLLEQALTGGTGPLVQGLRLNAARAGGGPAAGDAEEEDEEEEGDIVPPEPPAALVAQLTDMGFTEALSRKALLLGRGDVQLALEWILAHMDEPGAEDPPSQAQLRALYGRRRRGGGAAVFAAPAAGAGGGGGGAPAPVDVEAMVAQMTELLGQGLSAALAPGGAAGAAAAGAGAGGPPGRAEGAPGESGDEGEDEYETDEGEDDEYEEGEEYEDEEEAEFVDYDDDDDATQGAPGGGAPRSRCSSSRPWVGSVASMDLNELGSADMEQLLAGMPVADLHAQHQLLAAGGDAALGGGQGGAMRLMDVGSVVAALAHAAAAGQQAQQQAQQQQAQQQQAQQQQAREGGGGSEQQQQPPGGGAGS